MNLTKHNKRLNDLFNTHKIPSPANIVNRVGNHADLYLYDEITAETTNVLLQSLRTECRDCKTLTLNISSPGGSVFDSLTLYNALKAHPANKTARIQGLCASAATWIALACDKVETASASQWLIHNAWTVAVGNATELRKLADQLELTSNTILGIYTARTKLSETELREMMANETVFDANQAITWGFANSLIDNKPNYANKATQLINQTRKDWIEQKLKQKE